MKMLSSILERRRRILYDVRYVARAATFNRIKAAYGELMQQCVMGAKTKTKKHAYGKNTRKYYVYSTAVD